MKKSIVLILCYIGIVGFVSAGDLLTGGKVPPFNPGYLGRKQALSVQAVTNFAGFFRSPMRYTNNYALLYEIATRSTLSYQLGYKSYNRTVGNSDWDDYYMFVVIPGMGWSSDQYYAASGEMNFNYKEYSFGVKNYLSAAGATAPFGGYLLANLNYGLAHCVSNDVRWNVRYSSSSWDTLSSIGSGGVAANMVSVSYGFGTRNMITDQLGVMMEVTSGLTLKNTGGVKLYSIDSYSDNYNGPDQQSVMTSVMLREIHKSQWIQFKLGLSYLF